jgi:rubrerythrin
MSIELNADEILEMAQRIEQNGAAFYRRAAQMTGGAEAKELLLHLASMEDAHEKIFKSMRSKLTDEEKESAVHDPYHEQDMYLRAMADGRVADFQSNPAKKLKGKETLEEILNIALGLEKDTIVFYLGMKELVPEKIGKPRIDAIIKEEMGHVAEITKALTNLGK